MRLRCCMAGSAHTTVRNAVPMLIQRGLCVMMGVLFVVALPWLFGL